MERFGVRVEVGLIEKDMGVEVRGLQIFDNSESEGGIICEMLHMAMRDAFDEVHIIVKEGIILLVHRCISYFIIPHTIEAVQIIRQIELQGELVIRPLDDNKLFNGFMITV